jgi:N6-L-threonylcarbamoyladenine synthase
MNTESIKTYLAIETSCDETSIAILQHTRVAESDSFSVLAHLTLSQIDIHQSYGGVYPNLARREHETNITAVLTQTLTAAHMLEPESLSPDESARISSLCDELLHHESIARPILTEFLTTHAKPPLDGIVVTTGPGLAPALWVGVNCANALSAAWNLPILPMNHMEGHIFSVFAEGDQFTLPDITFPALALLISGGHTEIVLVQNWHEYSIIGSTLDDAIGEAFDKTARLMSLPYPGGPQIDRLAKAYEENTTGEKISVTLPRPMLHSGNYNFSFSGIKTAVRYMIDTVEKPLTEEYKQAVAHEFQTAVTEVLVKKVTGAMVEYGTTTLIIGGGVAANKHITGTFEKLCTEKGYTLYTPKGVLAMDNALMIAVAGALRIKSESVHMGALRVDAGAVLG